MPKGFSKRNQSGWKHSKESIKKISEKRKGLTTNENNPRWKGDHVSYPALHNWIRNHFNKPSICDICGINPGSNSIGQTKIQWANKEKYTRNRSDWLALCPMCHKKYDYKKLPSIEKICPACNKKFITKNKKKKACCINCCKKLWRMKKKENLQLRGTLTTV